MAYRSKNMRGFKQQRTSASRKVTDDFSVALDKQREFNNTIKDYQKKEKKMAQLNELLMLMPFLSSQEQQFDVNSNELDIDFINSLEMMEANDGT